MFPNDLTMGSAYQDHHPLFTTCVQKKPQRRYPPVKTLSRVNKSCSSWDFICLDQTSLFLLFFFSGMWHFLNKIHRGESLQKDLCCFDEPWQNLKNVSGETSLLVLEARTAASRLHLSWTWLIIQKSAQSLETSLDFGSEYLRMAIVLFDWLRLVWQSKHKDIIILFMTKRWSDRILAQLDVESVSADLRLAPCFAAALLWVSGTAWSVEPQNKGFSRTEIMTSCLRSCFTFSILSKIRHQHSSVSSQLWGWLRNACQRSLRFCFQPDAVGSP